MSYTKLPMTSDEQPEDILIPAGRIFYISRGEYSDYSIKAHFVSLQDIKRSDLNRLENECRAAAIAENNDDDNDYGSEGYFIPKLIKAGFVAEINCSEMHAGFYGELDIRVLG